MFDVSSNETLSSTKNAVDFLIELYNRRCSAGEPLNRELFIAEYPEFAVELMRALPEENNLSILSDEDTRIIPGENEAKTVVRNQELFKNVFQPVSFDLKPGYTLKGYSIVVEIGRGGGKGVRNRK